MLWRGSTVQPGEEGVVAGGGFRSKNVYAQESSGSIIGNSYKSEPIEYNFSYLSNQDDIDLNNTDLVRNTTSYNFLFSKSTYDFLVNPNFIREQKTYITQTSTGVIEEVGIKTGGGNYKVNDTIVFDDTGTSGYGAEASVRTVPCGVTLTKLQLYN